MRVEDIYWTSSDIITERYSTIERKCVYDTTVAYGDYGIYLQGWRVDDIGDDKEIKRSTYNHFEVVCRHKDNSWDIIMELPIFRGLCNDRKIDIKYLVNSVKEMLKVRIDKEDLWLEN